MSTTALSTGIPLSSLADNNYGATDGKGPDAGIEKKSGEDAEVNLDTVIDDSELETEVLLKDGEDVGVGFKACHYFRDGKRQIDFILVYEVNAGNNDDGKKTEFREKYEKRLLETGVELEEEEITDEKKTTVFVKVHVNFNVQCRYAEELCIKAPLQAHPNPSVNFTEKILSSLHLPNPMTEQFSAKPKDYYTCTFKKSKLQMFLGADDPDNFFSNRDRSRIAYEILQTTIYGKRKKAEIGIDRLVEDGVYSAAFPLHDGPWNNSCTALHDWNPRQVLRAHWARWGKWFKYQPLDNIREYFGEKIGLYFAWLGFYTAWLLPASIVGLAVFSYGIATMFSYQPANVVCASGDRFLMCPLCDVSSGCGTWHLNSTCKFIRVSYLFDHGGTVFFAVFMSFWAVCFLENWKRKQASLAHHWDCLGYEEEEERPRPEFSAKAPAFEKNPVTGVMEPAFPASQRIPRLLTSISAIVIMVVIVVVFIIAVILYRVLIKGPLHSNHDLESYASPMTSMSAAVFNLVLIMILGRVYEALAKRLTEWEMHRTQNDFEDHLTLKVFIFQFCNFYSSIVYIGFFKGRFVGYPGHYTRFLGLRNEDCSAGGCLIELAQQLAVIMIGKQIIGNVQEILIPKIKGFFQRRKTSRPRKNEEEELTPWEQDYQLIPNEGLFQEYLEMVLQFGFITIFVAAFPLAPLFALLNNWVEIRLDASKLVMEMRRPVAQKAEDIGIWFSILDCLAKLAVIANAFLIAFTSTYLDELVYAYTTGDDQLNRYVDYSLATSVNNTDIGGADCRYRGYRDKKGDLTPFFWRLLAAKLAFVIVFEHVVFFVCRMIDVVVPDIPEQVQFKIKRETYLARQALADVEMKQETE